MLSTVKKITTTLFLSSIIATTTFASSRLPDDLKSYIETNKTRIVFDSYARQEARKKITKFLNNVNESFKPDVMVDLVEMITGRKLSKERNQINNNKINKRPIFVGEYNQFIVVRWYDETRENNESALLI